MTTTQQDRVSYSYGFKVPGKESYSSVNVNMSISTDVRPGETPEEAMDRARGFVLAQCDAEMADAPTPASKPKAMSSVDDEAFDPNNTVHLKLATMIFDDLNIKSESSRSYKTRVLLKGKRVGDIGKIVRDDVEAFRKSQKGRA